MFLRYIHTFHDLTVLSVVFVSICNALEHMVFCCVLTYHEFSDTVMGTTDRSNGIKHVLYIVIAVCM